MSDNQFHGVRPEDEIKSAVVRPSIVPSFAKFMKAIRVKDTACFVLFATTAVTVVVPIVAPVSPICGAFFVWYVLSAKPKVPPLRVPVQEAVHGKLKQSKQLGNPETGFEKPSGIFFIGWALGSLQEMWMSNEDCREHFWIIGSTGSGKTELLMAFIANALSWGSGAYMIDGKGDVKTIRKVQDLCRAMGRDDDFLCLNFMPPKRHSPGLLTNRNNPMASYGDDEIIQMLLMMLPPASGDSGSWQERAISMISALVPVLVWLRDNLGVPLGVLDLRAAMNIQNLIKIAGRHEPMYAEVPNELIGSVKSYLMELAVPEDVIDQGGQPSPESSTQHGYRMQFFSRPLSSLGEGYRHIFGGQGNDVDIFDVVLNRRIVIAILPVLGKAMTEVENLGRILVGSMKTMLGQALGSQIEGRSKKVVDQRITTASSPYPVIFDECSFYMADGMSMLPAQGRALGFSFIFAMQSLQGAINRNQKEATEAFGTVNTKIFMKMEDGMASLEQAQKASGRAYVAKTSGWERDGNEFGASHNINSGVQVDHVERTDVRDLRKQWRGQITLQNGDTIIRGTSFYIEDSHIYDREELVFKQLNHLISLDEIKPEDEAETKATETIFGYISSGPLSLVPGFDTPIPPGDIEMVVSKIAKLSELNPHMLLSEAAAVGMAYLNGALSGTLDSRGMRSSMPGNSLPRTRGQMPDIPLGDDDDDAPMLPRRPMRRRTAGLEGGGLDNDTMLRAVTALDQPMTASAEDVEKALTSAITRNQSPTHKPDPVAEPNNEPTPGTKQAAAETSQTPAPVDDAELMAMFSDIFLPGGEAGRLVDDES